MNAGCCEYTGRRFAGEIFNWLVTGYTLRVVYTQVLNGIYGVR